MIDAIAIVLAAAIAALLCGYYQRRKCIAEFARRVTIGCRSRSDVAFTLATAIFGEVKRGDDPVFLMPLLAPLGGSPTTILKEGGCCSGVTRLYITSLATVGIKAAQVTVYRRADPAAAHCLAQVAVESGKILIDADYGVWLHHPDGSPVDLAGLRSGVTPTVAPFVFDREACYVDGCRRRSAGYPNTDYYRFDYELTRTANWADTGLKRAVYAMLYPLTRGRVDYLLVPATFEWPEVLLAATLCGVMILLLVARVITH